MMKAIGSFLTDVNAVWLLVGFLVIMVLLGVLYTMIPRLKPFRGQLLVISGLCLFTLLLFLMTFAFKVRPKQMINTTAATVPRIWAALMAPVAVMIVVSIFNATNKPDAPFGNWKLAVGIGVAAIASVFLFEFIGYYLSSALFLVLMMWLLRERNVIRLIALPVGWCVFTYFVFDRLLFMGLPVGSLFTALFG